MIRYVDVYLIPAVDYRARRPNVPGIRYGLCACGCVGEGLFCTLRAIAAYPVISHCACAVRVDLRAEGERCRADPCVAETVHRCNHRRHRKERLAADHDPRPDRLIGRSAYAEQNSIGVAQHPVALVRSGAVRSGEADTEIDHVTGIDVIRQGNHGRTIHQVAAIKDQRVAGCPGTRACIL